MIFLDPYRNVPIPRALAVLHDNSPYLNVYPFTVAGIGSKYANPGVLPSTPSSIADVRWSPAGTEIICTCNTSGTGCVAAYPWVDGVGFGAKLSQPAGIVGVGYGLAFSPDGAVVMIMTDTTPYIHAYPWSAAGFGTKYSDPGTAMTAAGNAVCFSPDGAFVAVTNSSSGFDVYAWNNSTGFGAKTASGLAMNGTGVNINNANNALAVTGASGLDLALFNWSAAGLGLVQSTVAVTVQPRSVAWAPNDSAIVQAWASTPFVKTYAMSGSVLGSAFSNPATLPAGTSFDAKFSAGSNYLAVVSANVSPFVAVYPWSAAGFGTKLSDPATLPSASRSLAWLG